MTRAEDRRRSPTPESVQVHHAVSAMWRGGGRPGNQRAGYQGTGQGRRAQAEGLAGKLFSPHSRKSTSGPNRPFQIWFWFSLIPVSQPMTLQASPLPLLNYPIPMSLYLPLPLSIWPPSTFPSPLGPRSSLPMVLPLNCSAHHLPSTETMLVRLFNQIISISHGDSIQCHGGNKNKQE